MHIFYSCLLFYSYYHKLGSACSVVGERKVGRITVQKPLFGKIHINSSSTLSKGFSNLTSLSILYLKACVLKSRVG